MHDITGEQALGALEQVVADAGPGYRHIGLCCYVRDGRSCCGVGRALVLLGVSMDTLKAMDDGLYPRIDLAREKGLKLSFEARAIFYAFQKRQDEYIEWKTCLEAAKQVFIALCTID